MKKVIAISSVLLGVVFLAGCGQKPASQTQSTTNQLPATPVEKKVVTFGERTVSKKDKNGFNIDLTLPQLTGTYDGITAINTYYDNKEKEFINDKTSAYYPGTHAENGTDFFLKAHYSEAAVIGDIISISGDEDSSAGGVSNPVIYGDVFDLNTGKKISLDDIFNVDSKKYLSLIYDQVSKSIREEMVNEKPSESRYTFNDDPLSSSPGTVDSARAKKAISGFDPGDFFLTDKSLVVFYQKYTLGSGASGTFKYEITFDSIADVLKIKVAADQSSATSTADKAKAEFTCGKDQVKDSDGNTYGTVQVGTQCWMNRNLNVGSKLDSASTKPADNGKIEKWCYDNDDANCDSGGGLYSWDEAMQYSNTEGTQGICPSGWHIPTDAEQYTLENYLKDPGQNCLPNRTGFDSLSCSKAGKKLKSGGTSGLNFPLVGNRDISGRFISGASGTTIWSSSQSGANDAISRSLYPKDPNGLVEDPVIRDNDFNKGRGFSVRCLKD